MKLRASLAKKSDKIVHVFTFDGHVWSPGFTIGIQTIQCSLVQKPGAVTLNTVHHHMRKLAEKKKKRQIKLHLLSKTHVHSDTYADQNSNLQLRYKAIQLTQAIVHITLILC